MKTSIYNLSATVLLIVGVYYYNIISMDEQKETNEKLRKLDFTPT